MITFKGQKNDLFLQELKKEVQKKFFNSTAASPLLVCKALMLISLKIFIYGSILGGFYPFGIWAINFAVLGFVEIMIAINVGHDAIHGAFTPWPICNKWLGYLTFDWIGLSSLVWKKTHNMGHHTFTNIQGADPDISKPGIIRLSPHDPRYWFHRFQHIYAWFLYAVVGLNWVFYSDYVWYFQIRDKASRSDRFFFFFWKVFTLIYFIAIPTLVSPLSFSQVVIGFVIAHFVGGLSVSVIFQLAHIIDDVEFPLPDKSGRIQTQWGEHEMRTTSNFATDSFFVTHFVGGLTFQIEHHLFPKISHGHYPEVAKCVRRASQTANLPYHEQPSFSKAVLAHARFLKKLGKSG